MIHELLKNNAKRRWVFRVFLLVLVGGTYLVGMVFFGPDTPQTAGARQMLRNMHIGVGGCAVLYSLYYLVWQASYKTMSEYRAMKRQGDPQKTMQRIESDIREGRCLVHHRDGARLFVLTKDYVFAAHWFNGGYATLQDVVCCTYTFEAKEQAGLYVWVRKKADSILYLLPLGQAEDVSDELYNHSPAMIGYDPKLKLLRILSYRAYTKACLKQGKLQREQ